MNNLKRILWPLLTCLALLYPAWHIEDLLRELSTGAASQANFLLRAGIGIGIWLAAAWLVNSLIGVLVWDRLARPAPSLLQHLVAIVVTSLAITGILGFVFGQSVTGIWATSGVLGLVVGFAARPLIADLFSGIALHLDPPFRIGDWIEWREGNEEILARVEQINWRSTRVHVRDDTKTIFIPNSHLSTVAVTNVFAPLGRTRQIIRIALDPAVDLGRATRVLTAAVLNVEGPLEEPPADVLLEAVTPEGLTFQIRYWHNPDISIAKVRSAVLYGVLAALDHAGIRTARYRHEIVTAPLELEAPERKDTRWVLRQFELFEAFSDAEIGVLAESARRREYREGELVVRQGEAGRSLFAVREGLLNVLIERPGEEPLRVGRLGQGQYFGELSLLTGEPRSATVQAATGVVLYELDKQALVAILGQRPEIAGQLAETIANRQLSNQETLLAQQAVKKEERQESFARQLLGRIKVFLGQS